MIPAQKKAWFENIFAIYNTWLLRTHFHRVLLHGREQVGKLDRSVPIIFYGNHSCWWDGLIEFYLSKRIFGFDSFLMMEEAQMERYRFFRRIGAFSVNRSSFRQAAESLRYAISLFDRPNRVLWIYPQAVMKPNDMRPLGFQSGIGRIAEALGKAQLVPIAHRYEFLQEQRPEAFISIGEPFLVEQVGDPKELSRSLELKSTELLDSLRLLITSGSFDDFSVILSGRKSINVLYDNIRST